MSDKKPLSDRLAWARRKVAGKGYYRAKHERVRLTRWQKPHPVKPGKVSRAKLLVQPDKWRRKVFTSDELKAMWLAVCQLVDYFGGDIRLLAEVCKTSPETVHAHIKKGRWTVPFADKAGRNPEVPLTREELRPDLSDKGWENWDQQAHDFWKNQNERTKKAQMKRKKYG